MNCTWPSGHIAHRREKCVALFAIGLYSCKGRGTRTGTSQTDGRSPGLKSHDLRSCRSSRAGRMGDVAHQHAGLLRHFPTPGTTAACTMSFARQARRHGFVVDTCYCVRGGRRVKSLCFPVQVADVEHQWPCGTDAYTRAYYSHMHGPGWGSYYSGSGRSRARMHTAALRLAVVPRNLWDRSNAI